MTNNDTINASDKTPFDKLTANDWIGKCRSITEFRIGKFIGEGTYGIVYKAKDLRDNKTVALKKIRLRNYNKNDTPISCVREIQILKFCDSPHIVRLYDVAVAAAAANDNDNNRIFLSMEFCDYDLASILDDFEYPFTESEIKRIMLQVYSGCDYLHKRFVLHRDLKLSNLLLTRTGSIKIADFGLARCFSFSNQKMSPNVVTLWYRAPELLFGSKVQTTALDIWATGCILAELLIQKPLFKGKSEIAVIDLIIALLGTPTVKDWPELNSLSALQTFTFREQSFNMLRQRIPWLSHSGIDLLKSIFVYNPAKRLAADQCLRHLYFRDEPLPSVKLPKFDEKSYRNKNF